MKTKPVGANGVTIHMLGPPIGMEVSGQGTGDASASKCGH
jgi:hypothetical protein